MDVPVLTVDLAARLEQSLARTLESRIAHVRRLAGNPLGVDLRDWQHVSGILVRHPRWYYTYFNAISGLRSGNEGTLDDALTWYRDNAMTCRVYVSPVQADERLLRHLGEKGFRQTGFMTVLFGTPDANQPPLPSGVTIQECPASDRDVFLTLWLSTAPAVDREFLEPVVRAEFAGWRCYVAFVDGRPVAVGGLHVHGGIGSLAAGMTLPDYRGRGCQTALLHRRITDAHAMGCDLVVTAATPGSGSQRNMERAGFRTAYTRSIFLSA